MVLSPFKMTEGYFHVIADPVSTCRARHIINNIQLSTKFHRRLASSASLPNTELEISFYGNKIPLYTVSAWRLERHVKFFLGLNLESLLKAKEYSYTRTCVQEIFELAP